MGHRYLQVDLETTRPEMLVSRLYQKAISCSREAQTVAGADAMGRTRSLRRSIDIVAELRASLDVELGGEIAANLDMLYEFVNSRLVAAGLDADDQPINDALRVLEPLAESWAEIAANPPEVER